jgi:limonene-1,2-epoxide hydrolase
MASDTTQRNIATVRALYEKFSHIDPDELAELFSEDAYVQPVMKDPYSGRSEIRRMFSIWQSHFGDVQTPLRNIVGSGNVVMTEWSDESTFKDKRYVIPCTGVFEFEGEKIKAWRLYYDSTEEARSTETGLNPRRSPA